MSEPIQIRNENLNPQSGSESDILEWIAVNTSNALGGGVLEPDIRVDSYGFLGVASGRSLEGSADFTARKASLFDIESVIEVDGRRRVWDTRAVPYRMICSLVVKMPKLGGTIFGTGALIGPDTVLTCAHNLFRHEYAAELQDKLEIGVYAGRNNNSAVRVSSFSYVSYPQEYLSTPGNLYDYAIIKLDRQIGDIGRFSLTRPSDTLLSKALLNLTGYPTDKDKSGRFMYTHFSPTHDASETSIFYQADTYKGNSGGPVYVQFDNGEPPVIVGIHTRADTESSPGESNQGRRIDDVVYANIQSWMG